VREPRSLTRDQIYATALGLEKSQPAKMVEIYRGLAKGSDTIATTALFGLIEYHAINQPKLALPEIDDYLRRFPREPPVEFVMWDRVTVLRALHRTDEARAAAAAYLKRFPSGINAKGAERILE
jgi:outer membrane protein assembly factor BamD (BamD/ComL family)